MSWLKKFPKCQRTLESYQIHTGESAWETIQSPVEYPVETLDIINQAGSFYMVMYTEKEKRDIDFSCNTEAVNPDLMIWLTYVQFNLSPV